MSFCSKGFPTLLSTDSAPRFRTPDFPRKCTPKLSTFASCQTKLLFTLAKTPRMMLGHLGIRSHRKIAFQTHHMFRLV